MHSCIYAGQVRHRRFLPREHRFRYRLFMMYLDLEELPALFRPYWLWSARRPALARFRRRDHLGDPAADLATVVRDRVELETGHRPAGPVRLLTHMAYFGYCFNPLSVYYCFADNGEELQAVVLEVSNTPWGEQHCYVLEAGAGDQAGQVLRSRREKEFHVSPFMPMDMEYDWRIRRPGPGLGLHIINYRAGECCFDATLNLNRQEITHGSLARVLILYPFMTLRLVLGIYYQAFRLWCKRFPFYHHPRHRAAAEVEQQ